MIISRTPFRISFGGGGSDIEDFYRKSEGSVLSTTIDKYMYLALHRHFDGKTISIKYRRTESVSSPERLKHPIVRSVFCDENIRGVELSSIGDVPAQTGLGSSSAFTVGLHHIVTLYKGGRTTPEELARKACATEIGRLKEPIGKQDQYAAAYGGLNFMRFLKSGKVIVEPLRLPHSVSKKLQENILLFYTGTTRPAHAILEKQKENIRHSAEAVSALKHMVEMAHHMREELLAGNLHSFGELLHDSWMLKRSVASTVSNETLDRWYKKATGEGGAVGGKLLGAGGGGFFLFYCEKENQARLRKTLGKLHELPFSFTSSGSEIIFSNHAK